MRQLLSRTQGPERGASLLRSLLAALALLGVALALVSPAWSCAAQAPPPGDGESAGLTAADLLDTAPCSTPSEARANPVVSLSEEESCEGADCDGKPRRRSERALDDHAPHVALAVVLEGLAVPTRRPSAHPSRAPPQG